MDIYGVKHFNNLNKDIDELTIKLNNLQQERDKMKEKLMDFIHSDYLNLDEYTQNFLLYLMEDEYLIMQMKSVIKMDIVEELQNGNKDILENYGSLLVDLYKISD